MGKGLENNLYESNTKSYKFEEVLKDSTAYFKGDEMAARNWIKKYALKDSSQNNYESNPDQMHHRIANEISRIEKKYSNPVSEDKVYELLKDFKYIVPQGSPMSGIGNNYQKISLSNCFVIGNEGPSDSYGGILKIDQEQVQLMKRRGGVGHDLSHIRPKTSPVDNSALTSTGVVPFMERYSNSTREVAQDGRRGALMLTISSKHPDAENFIDAKMTQGKITGANISVKIDNEFMEAIRDGKPYVQQYPVDSENPSVKKEIDPRELWDKIIHNAWKSAEPGVLFWDTVINESIPDSYEDKGYKTVSTNPCGEIPLCPYDSCRLLAMNLYSYVENPFTDKAEFNFDKFKEHSKYAQRFMDDIIDLEIEKIDTILDKVEKDPEDMELKQVEYNLWKKIKNKAKEGRRTGIGITGEGDMLAALNLRYGSDKAIEFSTRVHKNLAMEVYKSSVELAKERGAFEIYGFEKEKDNPFIQRLGKEDPQLIENMKEHGRRNISLLTIAPTGTTSQMAQTTSGIEPAYLISYERNAKINPNDKDAKVDFTDENGDTWQTFRVFHHKFEDFLNARGYDVEKVKSYPKEQLEEIIKESPYLGATANDIDWIQKVKLQGSVQKWVDHSISVTINMPEGTPKDVVKKAYMTSWESGCKGMTVYVDGSRGKGVLNSGKKLEKSLENGEFKEALLNRINKPRPEFVGGMKEKVQTPYGYNAFVGINWEKDSKGNLIDPYEAFVEIGKAGDDLGAIAQGFGRTLSLVLKAGIPYEMISEQLKGIGGNSQIGFGENHIKSLPDAIGRGMEKSAEKEKELYRKLKGFSEDKDNPKKNKDTSKSGNLCGKCGSPLIMEEGCEKCSSPSCDYSRCG